MVGTRSLAPETVPGHDASRDDDDAPGLLDEGTQARSDIALVTGPTAD
jgi:hypothetical protein